MTQDNMPDRIYAWFFDEEKQNAAIVGGWNDTQDRGECAYLKATPARKAAEDMLEALEELEKCITDQGFPYEGHMLTTIRAAIAKAKGDNT